MSGFCVSLGTRLYHLDRLRYFSSDASQGLRVLVCHGPHMGIDDKAKLRRCVYSNRARCLSKLESYFSSDDRLLPPHLSLRIHGY
jgi:hypothetical protein